MDRKLFFPLMLCMLLLAGCYRQSAETFQQVDSGRVEEIASPTEPSAVELSEDDTAPTETDTSDVSSSDGLSPTTESAFLTPQLPPAQVEQPTIIIPTSSVPTAARPTLPATLPPTATPNFLTLTATLIEPDADDPCIYTVVAGDTLFQLSLAYDTTVDALMELNELETEDLQIDQLLEIPDCAAGEESAVEAPAVLAVDVEGGGNIATLAPLAPIISPTPGGRIHIVVSGDTLGGLALFYDISEAEIAAANELPNRDRLAIGQELIIPENTDA